MSTILADALAYAERGWPVFACAPKGKRPLTERGFKDATSAPEIIREMWARWPDANVGVVTGTVSGFWVLDIDGDDGSRSLNELQRTHGEVPATAEARTGRGGRHLLFQHPGGRIRNRTRVRPGLDIRADGGYIIAPSSQTIAPYDWARDPREVTIAATPDWMLAMVQGSRPDVSGWAGEEPRARIEVAADVVAYAKAGFARELAELTKAQVGERNDRLNRAAFALAPFVRDGLLDRELVTRCLREIATAKGLLSLEIEKTIASGLAAGAANHRSVYQRGRLIGALRLSARGKLLLHALCQYSSRAEWCWPSNRTLIRDCSFGGFRGLVRALQDAAPFIEVMRGGRSNHYRLRWPAIEEAARNSTKHPHMEGCSAPTVRAKQDSPRNGMPQ